MSTTIVIKSGDNLWNIARAQGIKGKTNIANYVNSVIAANSALKKDKGNNLEIGQFINLPEKPLDPNIKSVLDTDLISNTNVVPGVFNKKPKDDTPTNMVSGVINKQPLKDTSIDMVPYLDGKPIDRHDIPPSQYSKAEFKPEYNTKKPSEPTTPLSDWMKECADSMVNTDDSGNPIYGKDVNPFDMAGEEFKNAVNNNDNAKAGEIYKEKSLNTAKDNIALYDKDNDGEINLEEKVQYDLTEFKQKYGSISDDDSNKMQEMAMNEHVFMDLNKDGKVDDKEYSSFLYAIDANNDKKIADGQITRDEYVKYTRYFDDITSPEAIKFRKTAKNCFKSLFGTDPELQN